MGDQALLSDLCRICTDATPKYCCPRCSTRTCSLQCYKRHQLWSQCSGKRDPGAYVKRSQLATAAGIDRDYNFLTGIERAFDAADRESESRGITSTGKGRHGGVPKPGSHLQQRLDASGAIIRKAPVGMSRQKSNRTQWHPRHKCIAWTVEWIHSDGLKTNGQCRENLPLSEVYRHILNELHSSKKRKATAGLSEPNTTGQNQVHKRNKDASTEPIDAARTLLHPTETTGGALEVPGSAELVPHDASDQVERSSGANNEADPDPAIKEDSSLPSPPDYHFYLHKPHTTSTSRILIPLEPSSMLSTCLKGQSILEYPTIFVLNEPATSLPEGFLLEYDYRKQEKKMIEELDEDEKEMAPDIARAQQMSSRLKDEGDLEDLKVLESLKKDLANVKEEMDD